MHCGTSQALQGLHTAGIRCGCILMHQALYAWDVNVGVHGRHAQAGRCCMGCCLSA
jgi:hypothetical protein